jgi:hypothetical protein
LDVARNMITTWLATWPLNIFFDVVKVNSECCEDSFLCCEHSFGCCEAFPSDVRALVRPLRIYCVVFSAKYYVNAGAQSLKYTSQPNEVEYNAPLMTSYEWILMRLRLVFNFLVG